MRNLLTMTDFVIDETLTLIRFASVSIHFDETFDLF